MRGGGLCRGGRRSGRLGGWWWWTVSRWTRGSGRHGCGKCEWRGVGGDEARRGGEEGRRCSRRTGQSSRPRTCPLPSLALPRASTAIPARSRSPYARTSATCAHPLSPPAARSAPRRPAAARSAPPATSPDRPACRPRLSLVPRLVPTQAMPSDARARSRRRTSFLLGPALALRGGAQLLALQLRLARRLARSTTHRIVRAAREERQAMPRESVSVSERSLALFLPRSPRSACCRSRSAVPCFSPHPPPLPSWAPPLARRPRQSCARQGRSRAPHRPRRRLARRTCSQLALASRCSASSSTAALALQARGSRAREKEGDKGGAGNTAARAPSGRVLHKAKCHEEMREITDGREGRARGKGRQERERERERKEVSVRAAGGAPSSRARRVRERGVAACSLRAAATRARSRRRA